MKQLFKFLSLPVYKKILLVKAAFLLVIMKLVVLLFPFGLIKRLVEGLLTIKSIAKQDVNQLQEIRWAIDVASNYIPFAKTCLVKSLAVHVLLIRNGFESTLNIGVTKDKSEKLGAHAWIEHEGKIIMGQSEDFLRYTLLE